MKITLKTFAAISTLVLLVGCTPKSETKNFYLYDPIKDGENIEITVSDLASRSESLDSDIQTLSFSMTFTSKNKNIIKYSINDFKIIRETDKAEYRVHTPVLFNPFSFNLECDIPLKWSFHCDMPTHFMVENYYLTYRSKNTVINYHLYPESGNFFQSSVQL